MMANTAAAEDRRTRFFLGCHQPVWLERAPFPLFVSHRRLAPRLGPRARKPLPVALAPWGLDSGAFTELSTYGYWRTTPQEYVRAVRRYRGEIGSLVTVSCQDWMCEKIIRTGGRAGRARFAGTGLSVVEHQRRTVLNALTLFSLDASIPWTPALQGETPDDYQRCADLYERSGIDLCALPSVGLGSVCRRQATNQIIDIVRALEPRGYRLHGYGVKSRGLQQLGPGFCSADSMSWSYRGRRVKGCSPSHKTESNCYRFAVSYRAALLERLPFAEDAGAEPGGRR
jgi:hypothetical protein